jgi:MFS family permease
VRIVVKLGPRRQLILGPGLAAAGLFWLGALSGGDGYAVHILGPLILIGFGLGISFVPMTLAATAGVPPEQAGLASALINTTRQMGGALGLAVLATVASSAASHHGASATSVAAALTTGYDRAFLLAAVALLIGAGVALLLPGPAKEPAATPAMAADDTPVTVEV